MTWLVYQTTPLFGGMRPIFVTHDRAYAKRFCDQVNIHEDGYSFCLIEERDDVQDIRNINR